MTYNRLFEPGRIGGLELKNRIVMPAMGCSLAESTGEAGARIIAYYAARAKGGAGLIITEITRVDDETGVGTPNQLSVTNTHVIPQLYRLAEAVHAYDTKLFVQLHHPGNQTPSRLIGGKQPVSASNVTCRVIGEEPRALTTEEVEAMVKKFVTGAVIAQKAGVDGVEIHAAHGYLVRQVHVEPVDAAVVDLAELVVETASQVHAHGVGVHLDELAQRVGEHDGACHHALVRQERVVLAHVHAQVVDDFGRFLEYIFF